MCLKFSKIYLMLLATLFLTLRVADAQAAPDDTGDFIVTKVLIDPSLSNSQQRFFEDDPVFMGRYVLISANRLAMDGDLPCTQVGRTWQTLTVKALLKQELHSYSNHPELRQYPAPSDMGLKRVPAGPVDMVRYACLTPDSGNGPQPGKEWGLVYNFPISTQARGLLWKSEVILILKPVAQAVSPKPGFDCKHAKSATEKAICSDPALASWDRSVTTAYTWQRDGGGVNDFAPEEDTAALVKSQLKWLAARDLCAADRNCLEDSMSKRAYALMQRNWMDYPDQ